MSVEGLKGRLAIVTGAARGIGAAASRLLAADGAAVVLCDLPGPELDLATEAMSRDGHRVLAAGFDITSEDDWRDLLAQLADERVDILVNNAGITNLKPLDTVTLDEWNEVIRVNTTGTFLGLKTMAPKIAAGGGGTIINIASMFSEIGGGGMSAAYHASKGAVAAMSRNAAVRWGAEGVRVNSVHPGIIETDMTAGAPPHLREQWTASTPLNRLGRAEDVAGVVAFLASDRAAYVTGARLFVDGGYTAR